MREIKFRGKRVDNGEWVYGCLVNYLKNMNPRIINCEFIGDRYEEDYKETNFEVLPETVGQLTDCKDKNGVIIHEGDILKGNKKELVVRFSEGCFTTDFGLLAYTASHREVIGNIHDKKQ